MIATISIGTAAVLWERAEERWYSPETFDNPVVPHSATCASTYAAFKSNTVVSYFAEIRPVVDADHGWVSFSSPAYGNWCSLNSLRLLPASGFPMLPSPMASTRLPDTEVVHKPRALQLLLATTRPNDIIADIN